LLGRVGALGLELTVSKAMTETLTLSVPAWLIPAVSGLLVGAGVVWIMFGLRSKAGATARPLEGGERPDGAREVVRLQEACIEAKKLTDMMAQELEARAVMIEDLIGMADNRVRLLRGGQASRLAAQADGGDAGQRRGGSDGAARQGGSERGTANGLDSVDGGGRAAPQAPARGTTAGAASEEFAARVVSLADQGLSVAEIARELGKHAGSVELVLALRRGTMLAA